MSTTMEDVREEERLNKEQQRAEVEALSTLLRSILAAAKRPGDNAKLDKIAEELAQIVGFRETDGPSPEGGLLVRVATLAAEALEATAPRR